jgi:hypothetical protein
MPSFRSAVYTVLSDSLTESTSSFDASRIKELMKIALSTVRLTISASALSNSSNAIWKGEEFTELADKFKSSERFKGALAIQNLLRQLVTIVSGASASTSNGGTKRKGAVVEEENLKGKKSKKEKSKKVEEVVVAEVVAAPVVVETKTKKAKKDKKT